MYYDQTIEDIYNELDSNQNGLNPNEAKERLKKFGKNILPKKKRPSFLKLYLNEFKSPIEIILVITVAISFLIGETIDAIIIIIIILVDTIMGAYQENKALKSAKSLNNMLKSKSKVLRDNVVYEIDSEEVTKGDIILLESGDRVNADARIIESTNLQIDESILTGESTTVQKNNKVLNNDVVLAERKNMVYAGCSVITGRAKAIVTAIGIDTEIGKIFKMVVDTKEEKTPLMTRMEKFTRQISVIIIIIAIISSIILLMNGYEPSGIFLAVVALAISAMPEGLPLALTMALTIASNKMSKKNVIVKNLSSVEALGSCTVIASDKTGTLTLNEQTARKIVLKNGDAIEVTGTGYNDNGKVIIDKINNTDSVTQIINLCAINNEATFKKENNKFVHSGDSIDAAFLALKSKYNINTNYHKEKIIPYESEKQYSAAFYKDHGKLKCTVKGSLEKIMAFSEKNKKFIAQNENLSKEGYRVIAVCDGYVKSTNEEDIKDLDFLGLVAFIDPVREEAKNSVKECQNAGVKVIMITGDHPSTALTIAKELDIAKNENEIMTGQELEKLYRKGEKHFDKHIKNIKVFSRVTPTDKLLIVESLKRNGEFVAVTGDGVNDAPAIKTANIGVAMGSGTDVAKDSADLIILNDDFTSIVEGIKEGRIAYSNIRKIIMFLFSCGIAEVLFYLLAVCFGYELPLVAIQLLWINIVTDGIQDMALSFEKGSKDLMMAPPRKTNEPLLSKDLMIEVLLFGSIIAFMIFSVWKYLMDNNFELLVARSIIMTLMVFIQNLHVLNCKSEKKSIFSIKILDNPFVIISIVSSIVLQLIVINSASLSELLKITNLDISTIASIFVLSLSIIIISEIYKAIYRIIVNNKTKTK